MHDPDRFTAKNASAVGRAHDSSVKRRRRLGVMSLLACVVVVLTMAVLKVPAVSITHDETTQSQGFYLTDDGGEAGAAGQANAQHDGANAATANRPESAHGQTGAQETSARAASNAGGQDDAGDAASSREGERGSSGGSTEGAAGDNAEDGDGATATGGEAASSAEASGKTSAIQSQNAHRSADVEDETALPAQSLRRTLKKSGGEKSLAVSVQAPEGALPADTQLLLKEVKPATIIDAVDELVHDEEAGEIDNIQAADITFKDVSGKKVKPAKDVTVVLSSELVKHSTNLLVMHVNGKGKAELVKQLSKKELKKRELRLDVDEAAFDAADFSVYALVATTKASEGEAGKTSALIESEPAEAHDTADGAASQEDESRSSDASEQGEATRSEAGSGQGRDADDDDADAAGAARRVVTSDSETDAADADDSAGAAGAAADDTDAAGSETADAARRVITSDPDIDPDAAATAAVDSDNVAATDADDSEAEADAATAAADDTDAAADSAAATATDAADGVAGSDADSAADSPDTDAAATADDASADPATAAADDTAAASTASAAKTPARRVVASRLLGASEDETTTDLAELFTELRLNGETLENGASLPVHTGETLDLNLVFKETQGENARQLKNDSTPMTYTLPEGLELVGLEGLPVTDLGTYLGDVSITVRDTGRFYTVSGNKVYYDSQTRQLKLVLNSEHDNFDHLTASGDASVELSISCTFDTEPGTQIDLGGGYTITLAEPNDPSVTKTAEYDTYTLPDGTQATLVKYVVDVSADGANDQPIYVSDAINGSALTIVDYPPIAITSQSKDGQAIGRDDVTAEVNENRRGFTATIPSMVDGETVSFTYYARVDTSKLSSSGEQLFDEAGNTATITNDQNPTDNPKNNTATAVPRIDFFDIAKRVEKDPELVPGDKADPAADANRMYRKLNWTVVANDKHEVTLTQGEPISDWAEYNANAIPMYYAGSGLTVTRTGADGTPYEPQVVPWTDAGVSDPSARITPGKDTPVWSWPVDTGGTDSYVITYSTYVDVADMDSWDSLTNNVTNAQLGTSTIDTEVGPPGPGEDLPVTKTLTYSDNDTCVWEVSVEIPDHGFDTRFEITDIIPYKWINNVLYKDTLTSLTMTSGQVEGESYETRLEENRWSKDRYIITFFRTDENGNKVPGAAATGSARTVTFKIETKVNQQWLDISTDIEGDAAWLRQHINKAEARATHEGTNLYGKDDANVTIAKKTSKKGVRRLADARTTFPGASEPVNAPVYQFHATFTGFGGNDGEDIVIRDVFNDGGQSRVALSTIRPFEVDFSDSPYWGNNDANYTRLDDRIESDKYTLEHDGNGFTLTIPAENIPARKVGGGYYSTIHLVYYLTPADMASLEAMRQDAGLNLGEAEYVNSVQAGTLEPATVKYTYDYKPLSKKYVADEENQSFAYRIELNAAKVKLNDGHAIQVVDTHSDNLAIDYATIKVEEATDASGADRTSEVSWDYSGSSGTFSIPDETAVVITYTAKVIGEVSDSSPATNEIRMLGYTESTSESEFSWRSNSEAGVYGVYLYKYGADHMETGLNGAVFRLLDSNKVPMTYTKSGEGHTAGEEIIFTTQDLDVDENDSLQAGYALIRLDQSKHGLSLRKNTVYYLEELKTPVTGEGTENEQHYEPDFTLYSFVISDHPDYDRYVYGSGDQVKVRNWPDTGGFYLAKRLNGNVEPPQSVLDNMRFAVYRLPDTGAGDGELVTTLTYGDLVNGKAYIASLDPGRYRVVETGSEPAADSGISFMSTYAADGVDALAEAEFEITQDDIDKNISHNVVITNTYYENSFSFTKVDADTGAALRGVEFTAYKVGAAPDGDEPFHVYTTAGAQGRFVVKRQVSESAWFAYDTLYYIVETKQPDGYQMPAGDKLVKTYFYFSNPDAATPWAPTAADGLPQGATATDLTTSYGSVTLDNQSDTKVSATANKAWSNIDGSAMAPDGATVVFSLYRNGERLDGADVELDGAVDELAGDATTTATQAETAPWHAEWTGLSKYDGAGNEYVYTVRETFGRNCEGYAPDTPSVASGKTITNVQESTALSFEKKWYGALGLAGTTTAWPANTYLRLRLTRQLQVGEGAAAQLVSEEGKGAFGIEYVLGPSGVVREVKVPETAGGTIERTTGAASRVYSYTIAGLETYGSIGAQKGKWVYSLAEEAVLEGDLDESASDLRLADVTANYTRLADVDDAGAVLLSNIAVPSTSVTATKQWNVGRSGQAAAVELTLYHKIPRNSGYISSNAIELGTGDDAELYDVVAKDATGNEMAARVAVSAADGWAHTFENLPRLKADDTPETYYVVETAIWKPSYDPSHPTVNRNADVSSYYSVELGEPMQAQDAELSTTVTNGPAQTVSLNIQKSWGAAFADDAARKAVFRLYANGEPYLDVDGQPVVVTLDGATDETETSAWQATVSGLPKTDLAGNEITWSWHEAEVTTGDGTYADAQVEGRFTVTALDGATDAESQGAQAQVTVNDEGVGTTTFTNDEAATTHMTVTKAWKDKNGNEIADVSASDYACDFTLYRTTSTPADVSTSSETVKGLATEGSAAYVAVQISSKLEHPYELAPDSVFACLPGDELTVTAQGAKGANHAVMIAPKSGGWYDIVKSAEGTIGESGVCANTFTVPNDCKMVYIGHHWEPSGTKTVLSVTRNGKDARIVGTFTNKNHGQLEALQSEEVASFRLSADDGWTYDSGPLPLQDANGNRYAYYVKEKGADANTVYDYQDVAGGGMKATVTNVAETTDVTVVKDWADATTTSHNADTVRYDLYRTTSPLSETGKAVGVKLSSWGGSSDNTGQGRYNVLESPTVMALYPGDRIQVEITGVKPSSSDNANRYNYDYRGLKKNNFNGALFEFDSAYFTLANGTTEGVEPDGSGAIGRWDKPNYEKLTVIAKAPDDLADLNNLFVQYYELGEVRVTNLDHPQGMTDDLNALMQGGDVELVKSNVELKKGSTSPNWTNVEKLPKYRVEEDGTKTAYRYFAIERPLDGYTASYAVTDSGVAHILNTPTSADTTTFTFNKVWLADGVDARDPQPWAKGITVKLYRLSADGQAEDALVGAYDMALAGGNVVATGRSGDPAVTVGHTGHDYFFTVAGLDKGGSYYVVEEPVDGYTTSYGYADDLGAVQVRGGQTRADAADPYIINKAIDGQEDPMELPNTGGFGTEPLAVCGAALMALSGAFLLVRRRG